MSFPNNYGGKCGGCGKAVAAHAGLVTKVGGKWLTWCTGCAPADDGCSAYGNGLTSSTNGGGAGGIPDLPPQIAYSPIMGPPAPHAARCVPPCTLALDEYQRAVIAHRSALHGEGLCAAAAGAGKTTTIVERIASLLDDGFYPEGICVLVYNTTAGKDLKTRLTLRVGETLASRITATTFHSWAYGVLRRWYPGVQRLAAGRILGTPEAPYPAGIIQRAMKAANIKGDWEDWQSTSGFIRESLIDIEQPSSEGAIIAAGFAGSEVRAFCRVYQHLKREENLIDFTDMLYEVALAIRNGLTHAGPLAYWYADVMVDEGQDINPARLAVATHLGGGSAGSPAPRLLTVGDARQGVYAFAGARPELFTGRLKVGARLYTLPVNRRSARTIVDLGNRIAEGRSWNLGGACRPRTEADVGEVTVWPEGSAGEESRMVAESIRARLISGEQLMDARGGPRFAVLVRTNAQAVWFESALAAAGIGARIAGMGGGTWATPLGRAICGYLHAYEGDPDESFLKVMNRPFRYIGRDHGAKALAAARAWIDGAGANPAAPETRADRTMRQGVLTAAFYAHDHKGADRVADDLMELHSLSWSDACDRIGSWLTEDAQEGGPRKGRHDVDDTADLIASFIEQAKHYTCVAEIEARVNTYKAMPVNMPSVAITTIHRAKGQEFDVVYVCGVTNVYLPHSSAKDIEEERRLFYVAVTRARHHLYLSPGGEGAQGDDADRKVPSPFLYDAGLTVPDRPAPLSAAVETAIEVSPTPTYCPTPPGKVPSGRASWQNVHALPVGPAAGPTVDGHMGGLPFTFDDDIPF